ncbi:MAG: DNA mismatch repair endonuclease MutL [Myxococcota bacterium]|nr:DNA mismatch repair endonuclease MutL [Myxococcota bacterium]
MTARNLFFNVPARKNFLRTDSPELGHCLEAVIREMLIRPHIDIEVKHNRSQVIRATPTTTLETRAIQLLGNQARGLIPIEFQQGHFRIKGAISPVGVHRATGQNNSYLYVNDRYVKDTALRRAIREAYQGLIPKGRYPTVILCVHLPPSDVDVNVHPAKTEVRFKNVKELCALLVRNLRGRLQEHGIKRSTQVRPKAIPPVTKERQEQVPLWEPKTPVKEIISALPNTQQQALLVAEDVEPSTPDPSTSSKRMFPKSVLSFQANKPVFSEPESVESLAPTVLDRVLGTWPMKTEQEMVVSDLLPVASFSELRVLGQLSTTYILCEGNGELVIIDQHAAHERITLFEMMQNVNRQGAWGQRLLSPILIELNPARYHSIVPHLKVLERYGLELEPFGGSTLALRQVPPFLGVSDWATLIEDVADDIALGGSGTPLEERLQLKLATTACHASIRAGDRLSPFRMQELLEELDGVDFGVCAHGRPVAIRIDTKELEKRFHRS